MTTPAGDDVAGSARLIITLDDTGVVGEAEELGQRIQRALDRATRNIGDRIQNNIQRALRRVRVSVQVTPDLSDFRRRIERASFFAAAGASISIPVAPDLRRFDAQLLAGLRGIDSLNIPVAPDLSEFMTRLRAALAGEEVSVRVVPDLDGFDARIRAHRAPDVTVNADVDQGRFARALAGLGGIAGRIGGLLASGLRFAAIGIAAAGAAQGVIALTAALAPAAGIIAAGPAVILGYQAALGTLKLALDGVSEAFSAALTGTAEEFQKTLEKLSPAAQAAAREVRALKPAFDDLKTSVQDAFFSQITGEITKTANALRGPLLSGLTRISAAWGDAAKGVLGYVRGSQGVSNVRSILNATGLSIEGLSQTTNKLTAGLLQVAAVVSDRFGTELAGGISNLGQRFGEFLQRAASGGDAVRWVDQALTVFAQLGDILGNLRSTFGGIADAASGAGAGVLGTLQQITQAVSDFINSTQGQTAIGNIFSTVATIGAQLRPILAALVTQIGQIAPALAPVFTALGPALVGVINSLGPAIAAIVPSLQTVAAALADGLGRIDLAPLGASIGSVLTALAPLLPLAGELVNVLGAALAPVLENLAAGFQPIISALVGALLPVLPGVAAAFVQVATAMRPLAAGFGQAIAQVFASLAPVLSAAAAAFQRIAVAIVPVYTALAGALLPLLPQLVQAFDAVLQAVLPVLPSLAGLVESLAPLAVMVIRLLAPVLQFGAAFVSWQAMTIVVPLIQGVVGAINFLAAAISGAATFIVNLPSMITSGLSAAAGLITAAFNAVVDFFMLLPGRIMAGLQALPGLLSNLFHLALQAVGTVIGTGIGLIILLFTRVPGLVLGALASFGSTLLGLFRSGMNSARSAVSSGVSAIVSFFSALPGRIIGFLSSLPGRLSSLFRSAGSSALSAARSFGSQVVSFFQGLPGRIIGAMSGAASALVGVGRDLVRGLISGVKAMAGSVASAAKEVVSSAIDAAKNVLEIGSPSKVFIQIGKDTGAGFVIGLTGTADQIRATTQKIAQQITAAFKGRNTKLDDRLLKLISDGNKQLTTLANQRDSIAKRIADAQKFATDAAASALQSFGLQNLSRGGAGVSNITESLSQALAQVRDFNTQVNALAQRGLRRDLLQQIIGLGPDQGAALADSLANASAEQLRQINSLQAQLASATDKLGKDSADALFDSGKEASRGFLAGLKGQQKDIQALMVDIARSMQQAIRQALGIRSPSRVFAKIGDLTGQGLQVGFVDRMREVLASARTAASSIAGAVSGELSGLSNVVAGPVVQPTIGDLTRNGVVLAGNGGRGLAGLGARTTVGATVTNNITVQAAADPEQTARVVMRRIQLANLT